MAPSYGGGWTRSPGRILGLQPTLLLDGLSTVTQTTPTALLGGCGNLHSEGAGIAGNVLQVSSYLFPDVHMHTKRHHVSNWSLCLTTRQCGLVRLTRGSVEAKLSYYGRVTEIPTEIQSHTITVGLFFPILILFLKANSATAGRFVSILVAPECVTNEPCFIYTVPEDQLR